ncbi:hypothetical protein F4820DRAFT_423000 [Hypoxylon rubiginosum]|uniref:Uncharacterized protein n=1 Tax=Hypoxylon rubiginosum TaxID=110542 RepID=A0ACB9YYV5_9PEZI|nr:hypothetical protein F4820DRAFT_423000 [Hypoxylon rubiginosum]
MAECPTSTSKTAIVVTQSVVQSDDEDFETQNFRSRYINLVQLLTLLRAKFGIGAYEIQLMQNSYYIRAPRKLSPSEIASCRCV